MFWPFSTLVTLILIGRHHKHILNKLLLFKFSWGTLNLVCWRSLLCLSPSLSPYWHVWNLARSRMRWHSAAEHQGNAREDEDGSCSDIFQQQKAFFLCMMPWMQSQPLQWDNLRYQEWEGPMPEMLNNWYQSEKNKTELYGLIFKQYMSCFYVPIYNDLSVHASHRWLHQEPSCYLPPFRSGTSMASGGGGG